MAVSEDGRMIFVTGHPEYDRLTLKAEYDRDVARGLKIAVPQNYFPGDDPRRDPVMTWRSHAHLLYSNWLNYCVYQATPFDLGAASRARTPRRDDRDAPAAPQLARGFSSPVPVCAPLS